MNNYELLIMNNYGLLIMTYLAESQVLVRCCLDGNTFKHVHCITLTPNFVGFLSFNVVNFTAECVSSEYLGRVVFN